MVFQESENIELRKIVEDDIKKEIVAFANCDGGKMYIGVGDDGTVTGVPDPDNASLQISNMVRDGIKPNVTMFIHYQTLQEAKKKLLQWMYSVEPIVPIILPRKDFVQKVFMSDKVILRCLPLIP